MSKSIYLDNSATTRPSNAAVNAALLMMTELWGNPSSTHAVGNAASKKIGEARDAIASALSAAPEEIYFTSGGTEANNIAVFGAASKYKRLGGRVVTTAIEHSSVMDSTAELERRGFEVIRVEPDSCGHISASELLDAVNDNTFLVTMMLVNNEVGSILPVEQVAKLVRKKAPRAIIHCDCVQAFGKIPLNVKRLGVDMLTVSAHKIHAPKGVGALYKRKGLALPQLTFGGHQEYSFRPGTEAAPLIAAFGEAAKSACDLTGMKQRLDYIRGLSDYAVNKLKSIDGVVINSPPDALPYIVNFSTCCIMAETMLNYLSSKGIYVSSGSACAKGEPSHVIKALHLPKAAADSAIRISFCAENTTDDIDRLASAVSEGMAGLAHFKL